MILIASFITFFVALAALCLRERYTVYRQFVRVPLTKWQEFRFKYDPFFPWAKLDNEYRIAVAQGKPLGPPPNLWEKR